MHACIYLCRGEENKVVVVVVVVQRNEEQEETCSCTHSAKTNMDAMHTLMTELPTILNIRGETERRRRRRRRVRIKHERK